MCVWIEVENRDLLRLQIREKEKEVEDIVLRRPPRRAVGPAGRHSSNTSISSYSPVKVGLIFFGARFFLHPVVVRCGVVGGV